MKNEEANLAQKKEMYRQGYRNFTNTEQPGNERYVNVKYKGGARNASTYRQQLHNTRSLYSKPAQTHLQSIHTKINIQE
jgi:hypothetical protein